jgi:hypothetical protein
MLGATDSAALYGYGSTVVGTGDSSVGDFGLTAAMILRFTAFRHCRFV